MVKVWQVVSVIVSALLIVACAEKPLSSFDIAWRQYKARFYENGRIVDTGNADVSCAEGQGYGMLFAVAADDQAQFSRLWTWSQTGLQREDRLFRRLSRPCLVKDRGCVYNRYSDTGGDILIAWALLKAAHKWNKPDYQLEAMAIIHALSNHMVISRHGETLLLSGGPKGVFSNGDVQVNLSNWVFPALQAFAEATGDEIWDDIAVSGIALIAQSESKWQLVPAWLRVSRQGVSLNGVVSPEFDADAYRVPLYLAWQGVNVSLVAPFLRYWNEGRAPATWNLLSNEKAGYPMTADMLAVEAAVRTLYRVNGTRDAALTNTLVLRDDMDYVSASLVMLSLLAVGEGIRQ